VAIHITKGDGAPTTAPAEIGQHYVDTTNDDHYLSVGNQSVNDWILVSTAGDNSFINLSDTPSSYLNQASKTLKVNTNADGIEFVNTLFLDDIDTPSSYTGVGGYVLHVKETEDGIEFLPAGGGGGLPAGGIADDIIVKQSAVDGDALWESLVNQPAIVDLDGRIDNNENQISTNAGNITTNATDISDLQTNKEDKAAKGAASGYAPLDAGSLVPDIYLPADLERTTNKGAASGYAPLASDSRVPKLNLPSDIQYTDGKGAASGYAPLDTGARVPDANLPTNIERTDNKGQPSGYAPLDGAGLIDQSYLPPISASLPQTRAVYVDGALGDDTPGVGRGNIELPYATIKAAVDYVATQTPTVDKKWAVRIQPGEYLEAQFTIPSYTSISGVDNKKADVYPTADNAGHFISMGTFSEIYNLNISGDINKGGSIHTAPTVLIPSANGNVIASTWVVDSSTAISISNGAGSKYDVTIIGCRLENNTLDYEQKLASVVFITETLFNDELIRIDDRDNIYGIVIGDNKRVSLSDFYVGTASGGRRATFGTGGSFINGMLIYEYDSVGDTFTDVTANAKDPALPDFGIPNTTPGSAIFMGLQLKDASSLSLAFSAFRANISQAAVLGSGSLLFQIYTSEGWSNTGRMVTQAFPPYQFVTIENNEVSKDYHLRLSDDIESRWVRTDPIIPAVGEDLYWVRLIVANNWYNEAWEYRLPMTIPFSQINTGVQNDLPVYLDLSLITEQIFWSNVNVDGGDIRVANESGIELLAIEIVKFDRAAQTGQVYFNSVELSNTVDNKFWLYYGNAAAQIESPLSSIGQYEVWKIYDAVFHFEDGNETWQDATINAYHANNVNVGGMFAGPTIFGQSIECIASSNAGADLPDVDTLKAVGDVLSWEAYHTLDINQYGRVASLGGGSAQKDDYFAIHVHSSGNLQYMVNQSLYSGLSATPISDGTWHQSVLYCNGGELWTWKDGVSNGTSTYTSPIGTSSGPPRIGNRGVYGGAYWYPANSGIDEFRITRRVHPNLGFYPTMYNTMRNPVNFVLYGANETINTSTGTVPITTTPRFNNIAMIIDNVLVNKDGFIEYFGKSRTRVVSRLNYEGFENTTGSDAAAVGGDIWLTTDFGIKAPFSFAANELRRITTQRHLTSEIDLSCQAIYKIYFIPRGSSAGGDVLWRNLVAVSDDSYVYGSSEGNAASPGAVTTQEGNNVYTINPGDEDKEHYVTGRIEFPMLRDDLVNGRSNTIWMSLFRQGTSSLDTYDGSIDLVNIEFEFIRWRDGTYQE
jgi:hypothetical protein